MNPLHNCNEYGERAIMLIRAMRDNSKILNKLVPACSSTHRWVDTKKN